MAKIYRSSDTPRDAAMRSTVSPILLFGVDAPAVTPTVSGPLGNHPVTTCSSLAPTGRKRIAPVSGSRSEEHTSELQSLRHLVCRLLLEKKKIRQIGIDKDHKLKKH